MSVGGKVIETVISKDRVWVNTDDHGDLCAIYVERTPESRSISPGDVVWWQGGVAFWTPRSIGGEPPFVEKELKRIGYSGVSRPPGAEK